MELRKIVIAQAKEQSYIKNGLVLWMDGIDKGNVNGSWVDKISGHIFTGVNNPTFGNNYVELSANNESYLVNTTFKQNPSYNAGTIEAVISDFDLNDNHVVYYSDDSDKITFTIIKPSATPEYDGLVTYSTNSYVYPIPITESSRTVSVNSDVAIVNGSIVSPAQTNSRIKGYDGNNYIGKRPSGIFYYGKIYSIRVYNRKLSSDEILHNQRVDNKKFHLGLSI